MPNQYQHPEWKRWLNHAAGQALVGVLSQVAAMIFPGPFYWLLASPIYMAVAGGWLARRFARAVDPGVSPQVFVVLHVVAQLLGAVLGLVSLELIDSNARTLVGSCLTVGLASAFVAVALDVLLCQRAARRQVQAS